MSAQLKRLALEMIREVMTAELVNEQINAKIGALIQYIWTDAVSDCGRTRQRPNQSV
jgi:hypothetical protein